MKDVNKVMLTGTVMRDPEIRANGDLVTFTLATSESFKKQDGTTGYVSEYHNCSVWQDDLRAVARNAIRDKSRVSVEGRITHNKKEKPDGTKVVYNGIKVEAMVVLGYDAPSEAKEKAPEEDFSDSFVQQPATPTAPNPRPAPQHTGPDLLSPAGARTPEQQAAYDAAYAKAMAKDDISIDQVPF